MTNTVQGSDVETASHAGYCLINLVNIGSRRVMKIHQNVWQLAHYFHTPDSRWKIKRQFLMSNPVPNADPCS